MRRHPGLPRITARPMRATLVMVSLAVLTTTLLALAAPVRAAEELTMETRTLLGGHARAGTWMAISVRLRNDGPAVTGELRLAGGTQGQTRYGTLVDLPSSADQTYVLYAQPPAFGNTLEVVLVEGNRTLLSSKVSYQIHDPAQLVVAFIAENPERIVSSVSLLPNRNQVAPLVIGIRPEDLPARVEAWGIVDRIIWQDVDSERLETPQRAALQAWIAGGGRLVISGGTVGPRSLSAFPDSLLPYRPVVTADIPASSLRGMLGGLPAAATTLPALAGSLIDGRILASLGDQVVAAERSYGSGAVTILGFDPTVDWIAGTDAGRHLWRQLLPERAAGGLSISDDNLLLNAVSQLPALALPPIGGLFALLAAYIIMIGPLNYLVLKRLDRREWAWATMPILIVAFAAGAYGIGAAVRGSEVIVHEVAIVRGAPGTTEGAAQVYMGIFSPSRTTYQVRVPGGALLSSPIAGDFFGDNVNVTGLDILQGDPAAIRDLAVGFGSLRTVRAESSVDIPLVQTDLRLEDGRLRGTIRNASDEHLAKPAVVLGQTVALLQDLEPGAEATVDIDVQGRPFTSSLADLIVGQPFFDDSTNAVTTQTFVRRNMVDQLTYDPNFGATNLLPADGPVVIAWGSSTVLPIEIAGEEPRYVADVLYYLPAKVRISGPMTFRSDLIRSTAVAADAFFFSKEPQSMNFGRGSVTIAYRPIGFEGKFSATALTINLGYGDDAQGQVPIPVEPLPTIPPPCPDPPTEDCGNGAFDGIPEVEVYDIEADEWRRLPHLQAGSVYGLADPDRYIDPTSGGALIRYVNDSADSVGFGVNVSIAGVIR